MFASYFLSKLVLDYSKGVCSTTVWLDNPISWFIHNVAKEKKTEL